VVIERVPGRCGAQAGLMAPENRRVHEVLRNGCSCILVGAENSAVPPVGGARGSDGNSALDLIRRDAASRSALSLIGGDRRLRSARARAAARWKGESV
jgi:hypothetical protein